MRPKILFLLFLLLASSFAAYAQLPPPIRQASVYNNVPFSNDREASEAARVDRKYQEERSMASSANSMIGEISPDPAMSAQLAIEEAVKVPKQDKAPHAVFLKEKHTGIFQLVPEENCGLVVSTTNPNPVNPNSAFYSFRREWHIKTGGDLGLKKGTFGSGLARDTIGMIASLGEQPLQEVDLNNNEAKRIAGIASPKTVAEFNVLRQNSIWTIEAKLNQTYILRSIQAGVSDLTIVFRVVAVKPNGNTLIIWKRLQKLDAPDVK